MDMEMDMETTIRQHLEANAHKIGHGEYSIQLFDLWQAGCHYETVQRGPVDLRRFSPTEQTRRAFASLLETACLEKGFHIVDGYDLGNNVAFYIAPLIK